MHNAPSVSYPVGRSPLGGALLGGLWLAGALALAAWTWQAGGAGVRQWLGAAVLASAGLLAAWAWWHMPQGELGWNGLGWSWPADAAEPGAVAVGLDLQQALLLHWQSGGPAAATWLWLERSRSPERWDDLRRAVYSRATPEALAGARPPAAKP